MLKQMKDMAAPYATLFAMALVVAVIARVGLMVMDITGALSYDYISAANVPILDVICSILTGSAFVAFLFLAALVLGISLAGVALQGLLYAQGNAGAGRPSTMFLWGWATALIAIVCAVVVGGGILSAVQVGSMSSKLPSIPVMLMGALVFAAFMGTLLAAASAVVCACVAYSKKDGRLGRRLVVATAVCGLIVMVLTVGTFSALNTASMQLPVLMGWIVGDIAVNIGLMFTASTLMKRV